MHLVQAEAEPGLQLGEHDDSNVREGTGAPEGKEYDAVCIWPRGAISAGETPQWCGFSFTLKVGTA